MNIGEILWVEFPARGGRAQSGRRPAIVVQKDRTLPTVLLVPLTTNKTHYAFREQFSSNPTQTIIYANRPSRSFFN